MKKFNDKKKSLLLANNDLNQEELDEFFMKKALEVAYKAYKEDEVPIGAVLVHKNKIIAKGYNQVELLKDSTAHAEILCLTSAMSVINDWRLLDTTLYSTVEPCLMCAGAIINSRVKRLVWSAQDLRVGANGSFIDVFFKKHPIHNLIIEKNFMPEESEFLLKKFFEEKRNKKSKLKNILDNS